VGYVIQGWKPSETFLMVPASKALEIMPRILADDSCNTGFSGWALQSIFMVVYSSSVQQISM
jgi:hypothetical protein